MAGTHPDLLQVAKPDDKQELPIRVIRDLCLDLGLKPMSGRRKVAIVDDADDLNDEAANAFLKTLEEPPAGSVLILVGTSAEGQLDTILSRCRVLRFDALPESELAELLVEQQIVANPVDAAKLARLAEGSVARARGLADPALADFRRGLFVDLSAGRGFDPSGLARQVEAFLATAGKEASARRIRARLVFGELLRLFRAAFRLGAGSNAAAPDPDDAQAAEVLADRLDLEVILALADRCMEAEYHVRRNLYLPMVLDSLFHDLGQRINPHGR